MAAIRWTLARSRRDLPRRPKIARLRPRSSVPTPYGKVTRWKEVEVVAEGEASVEFDMRDCEPSEFNVQVIRDGQPVPDAEIMMSYRLVNAAGLDRSQQLEPTGHDGRTRALSPVSGHPRFRVRSEGRRSLTTSRVALPRCRGATLEIDLTDRWNPTVRVR